MPLAHVTYDLCIGFSVDDPIGWDLTMDFDVNITTICGYVRNYAGQIIPCGRYFLYPKWGTGSVYISDDNGYFAFSISEGEEITLVIPDAMYDKKIIVPILDPEETKIEYNLIPNPDIPSRFNFPTVRFKNQV